MIELFSIISLGVLLYIWVIATGIMAVEYVAEWRAKKRKGGK